jgi:hypothetical protein
MRDVGTTAWYAQTIGARAEPTSRTSRPIPALTADGAGGGTRTPTGLAALRIFLPATAFAASRAPHRCAAPRVCGLDYPFTVLRPRRRLGAARLVSTPSRPGLLPSGLGSGLPVKVSPSLGSSASWVSRRSTQVASSPLRLPVSPRPRDQASISFEVVAGLDHFCLVRLDDSDASIKSAL